MRALGGLILAVWLCACDAVATAPTPATSTPAPSVGSPTATISAPRSATPSPAPTRAPMWGLQACEPDAACNTIVDTLNRISLAKMNDHLLALTGVGSRDPRHPGHAKAVAYIKEQLGALAYYGWKIESQRTVYQGIPLENIFATLDPQTTGATPPPPVGATGWGIVSAHYDSTA